VTILPPPIHARGCQASDHNHTARSGDVLFERHEVLENDNARGITSSFTTNNWRYTMSATSTNPNAIYSTMVKSGKTTYFIDLKEAKNGNKYLSISETHMEGTEKKRSTVRVFGETMEQFRKAIEEAAAAAQ
jgi:hypothetical protein